jgi:hypothetical protein
MKKALLAGVAALFLATLFLAAVAALLLQLSDAV